MVRLYLENFLETSEFQKTLQKQGVALCNFLFWKPKKSVKIAFETIKNGKNLIEAAMLKDYALLSQTLLVIGQSIPGEHVSNVCLKF